MAAREASLKFTLKRGAFKAGLNSMVNNTKKAGKAMGRGIKEPLSDGFKAAKKDAGELFASVKSGLGMIATLGGAVSIGAGIKDAMQAQEGYAQLSGILTELTGESVSYADAQNAVQTAAKGANASLDQTRTVMEGLVGVSGDAKELSKNTELAMNMARRLGVEGDFAAESFAALKAHTKASGEETAMMLERISKYGRTKLGLHGIDAINPNDIAEWSSFAEKAKMSMEGTVRLIEQVPAGIFKDMGQASEFIEEISNGLNDAKGLGDMMKALKMPEGSLDPDANAFDNLEVLIAKKGAEGIDAAMAAFGNERNMENFRELLGKDLILKARVGNVDERKMAKDELIARTRELQKMSQATADVEGWKAKTAKRNADLQNTAAARMREALRKVETAFESPKMMMALEKLANKLPELADGIADLISWVTDNPGKAASAIVLGKVGMSFTGAMVQSAAAAGMKAIWTQILTANAASAASSVATKGATAIGLGGAVAAGGAATVAAIVGGTLAAAAGGVAVGTAARYAFDTDERTSNNLGAVTRGTMAAGDAQRALAGGNLEKQRAAFAEVEASMKSMDETADIFEDSIGGLVSIFSDIEGVGSQREAKMKELAILQDKLTASIKKELDARKLSEQALTDGTRVQQANTEATKGGTSTTRGPVASPEATAGADNVGG